MRLWEVRLLIITKHKTASKSRPEASATVVIFLFYYCFGCVCDKSNFYNISCAIKNSTSTSCRQHYCEVDFNSSWRQLFVFTEQQKRNVSKRMADMRYTEMKLQHKCTTSRSCCRQVGILLGFWSRLPLTFNKNSISNWICFHSARFLSLSLAECVVLWQALPIVNAAKLAIIWLCVDHNPFTHSHTMTARIENFTLVVFRFKTTLH